MSFLDTLSGVVEHVKSKLTSAASPVTNAVQTTLPDIATDKGAQKLLGTAPEDDSMTMSGGRKHRRTHRRHRRRHTHRRRRGGGNCSVKCEKTADGRHDFGSFVNLGDVKERQCKSCKCVQTV
jgi:hypothetical protein